MKQQTTPTDEQLRAHYAQTAFARMGIPFDDAVKVDAVRIALAGAVAVQARQ